jgi:hypothetical protein
MMIHINHEMAVVIGVADQTPVLGVHEEVEALERDIADEDGTFVRELRNIDRGGTPLDRQPDGSVDPECRQPCGRLGGASPDLGDPLLLDQPPGHPEEGRPRINPRVGDLDAADLVVGDLTMARPIQIDDILDLGGNQYYPHGGGLPVSIFPRYGT